ncbi:sensor histidine kinase [Virgibacillus salexigens]|uniref:histidine kinase n=1 Tax=Virgibacillus massiliensis TaxID=1462526 RepID=A0A024Q6F5_9BACI|nr:HAMP domain-containing sensor histidine kinase [Virgibacillus massiliensis]CDQ38108.1 Sensor protein ZraS [Virgibacillus massiliensis]
MKVKHPYLTGIIGLLLMIYGFFLPYFVKDWTLFIVDGIQHSIVHQDSGQLMITSFAYVGKYTLIFFLIYFGALVISFALYSKLDSPHFSFLFIGIVFIAFFLFNIIFGEYFSYVNCFVSLAIIIFLQIYIPKQKFFFLISSIIIILILFATQWIQLVPALSKFGFGTNDLAISIKTADLYFTNNKLYNTLATLYFLVFLVIAIILTFLIHLLNKQFFTLKKYQQQEEELKETRIALIESKVYEEITTLVHDLKTPLVTIEGLLSLLEMKSQVNMHSTFSNYFVRIGASLDNMKDMISEILYENIKKHISVEELFAYVTSHLGLDNHEKIHLRIDIDQHTPPVFVNKIRFSRAISNIIENAIASFAHEAGYIHVRVKRINSGILFRIQDNGPGIEAIHMKNIWHEGFSTKNSSGIGLSFVKSVVENHGGKISVKSEPGNYTQMNIVLPVPKEGEKKGEVNDFNCR